MWPTGKSKAEYCNKRFKVTPMKKIVRYGLILIAIVLLGYNSVYIKSLSEVKAAAGDKFDAAAYVAKLWKDKLPARLGTAADINEFKAAVAADADAAFEKYSNALAVGNFRYTLVKGAAKVEKIDEDDIDIAVNGDVPFKCKLATEFIYGNSIRDASGLVALVDFPNTSDLNSISEELNKTVREQVVPSFRSSLSAGSNISFVAAVELNKEHIHFDDIELVPLSVKIVP